MNISISPLTPNSLKLTAHGYMKITSISKSTNKIATKKYFMENGCRALPIDLIPDSNATNLSAVLRLGPIKWVRVIVKTTNPRATII